MGMKEEGKQTDLRGKTGTGDKEESKVILGGICCYLVLMIAEEDEGEENRIEKNKRRNDK